jgi:penicillin amidase
LAAGKDLGREPLAKQALLWFSEFMLSLRPPQLGALQQGYRVLMSQVKRLMLMLVLVGWVVPAASGASSVEILRDPWGVPHVFAETDADAFRGLGYATAEDRALQMTYALRLVQGRLAEVVGEVRHRQRNQTSLDHDRRLRTFGFHRVARRVADQLDPESRTLLDAYADGVNTWFREHPDQWEPRFRQYELRPEPWTAADCLAVWWHLGQFFATDGTRELISARNAGRTPGRASPGLGQGRGPSAGRGAASRPDGEPSPDTLRLPPDDAAAVVRRSDLTPEWMERVMGYAREHGIESPGSGAGADGPKFSHAWVVGGQRTTTGSSVLVSDPQTPVRNPSLLYEFHLQGKTFNARGVGVAGSPVLLIGFTEQVAWGATALGADQADLFRLETDSARPGEYRFDGHWRSMTQHREILRVRGGDPVELMVRETHLGPVATAFSFALPEEGEVALKRIPLAETDRDTFQGYLAMLRSKSAKEFDVALGGWRFPSANIVFGDRHGAIGYRAVGALPVRSRMDRAGGHQAMPGHRAEHDWQEILPADLMPGVLNPAAGVVFSGNHRAIEIWYPIPLGAMTGAGGDTVRSWRLRERLEARDRFTPEDVLDIHFDTVNPARRELVRLGLHLRDTQRRELPEDTLRALEVLEPWYRAGARSDLRYPGAEVALELNTFFRFVSTDLALVYGGGESGLTYFLKTMAARLASDAQASLSAIESDFVERSLGDAWKSALRQYGDDPKRWNDQARAAVGTRRLGYMETLDGYPELDPDLSVRMPELTAMDGGTLACQPSQSYTQWVPMHDPDQARSLLPIGASERFGHPSRTSTLASWAEGRLHPAPLSRAAVEALGVTRHRVPAAAAAAGGGRNPGRDGDTDTP